MANLFLICAAGIVGLVVARWVKSRTKTDWIDLACVPWLFVVSIVVEHAQHQVYYQSWRTGSCSLLLAAGLGIACARLVFVIGLARFWPRPGPLGFPVKRVFWSMLVGFVAGSVQSWAIAEGQWPTFLQLKAALAGWYVQEISATVMQEAVYRGRVMDALRLRIRPAGHLIACQALVFAAFHVPGMLRRHETYPSFLAALPDLGLIFLGGCVAGILRYWRRDLWAPVAQHAVYNILIQTMTFKV
jgi:membrane protease YdiL (CAAX protease family)